MSQAFWYSPPAMKGRLEDRRLLTGQGRFTSDWNFPNQAYAVFLRSDRAHAEIVSVDVAPALAAPGVLAVLTGKDVAEAGYRSIPTNLGVKDRFGEPLKKPPRPVLAQGKVRHVGECLACIVAESAQAAQDAAELIAVEYRELAAAPGCSACCALVTAASSLYSTAINSAASCAACGDSATTQARHSPTWRTFPCASTGRGGFFSGSPCRSFTPRFVGIDL